ncbi:hypothetical protein AB1Y20_010797 [Prymnesium parvum]|uniref:Uncharacterized protein n=1 Tax=Prymnesium parvum TaxID=97485 RepID=A0AB34IPJ1_PRYPA|mmetsp:Transcript_21976/g.54757  ORF Transcript_21976/g.54757 Transcript_21976/m.54757 type:complete len:173 (-) Transcript_21976:242-760(-)
MTPLDMHTIWSFLLEIMELACTWWFYSENRSNAKLDSWIMPAELAWLICASVRLACVRVSWSLVPTRDVYSYLAVARALGAQASVDRSKQHEDALYRKARDNGCEDAMRPSRRRAQMVVTAVALHAINALLVGLVHIQDRISAASALSQIPSIYLACFYISRSLCFPPKIPA